MSIFLIIFIVSVLMTILGIVIYNNSLILEGLGALIGTISAIVAFITFWCCLSLLTVKAENKERFNKKQQEYIVITQYIKSDKSNSLLESTEILNKIENYNKYVIQKQNDMTRPLRKYWTEGADWNELKLINLETTNNKEAE